MEIISHNTDNKNPSDIGLLNSWKEKVLGTLTSSGDYFLDNPIVQPKYDIASYVESQGILVPQRFSTLAEAIQSGKNFIIRSEHPTEYYGASGLFKSYVVKDDYTIGVYVPHHKDDERIDVRTIPQDILEKRLRDVRFSGTDYPRIIGIDEQQYYDHLSFSYREFLGGYNRSIIADSAIKGRYHIFTTGGRILTPNFLHNYTIYDNGSIESSYPSALTDTLRGGLTETITFYERIRNLPKFNKNHCPIIEFQTNDNNNYFLQYHRTIDEDLADFTVDESIYDTSRCIKAVLVRGKTPKYGKIYTIGVQPNFIETDEIRSAEHLQSLHMDGAITMNHNLGIREFLAKKHKIKLGFDDLPYLAAKTYDAHMSKSKIFKGELFVSLRDHRVKKRFDDFTDQYKHTTNNNPKEFQNMSIMIKVISDGRKCLVELLS